MTFHSRYLHGLGEGGGGGMRDEGNREDLNAIQKETLDIYGNTRAKYVGLDWIGLERAISFQFFCLSPCR